MGIRTAWRSPVLAASPAPAAPAGRRAAHRLAVTALTAVTALGYCGFALAQWYTMRSTTDDLIIFDQAVRSYAHFKPGTSIMIGYHLHFGPNFSLLGNHFSPILIALVPLYWIHDSPVMLLLAQAVLFALAIPWLWVFTRRAFGGGSKATAAAYLVAVAYALSWPIASALAFNFHEVAFAPLFMAIVLERLQAGKLRPALIALFFLLLVKEDMGLFTSGLGAYLLVSRRIVPRQRLAGLLMLVGGVTYTVVATDVLIPAFGGKANFYWAYDSLGANLPQALEHMVLHPLSSAKLLITPRVKLDTMLWLVGGFCFLPLLSPISLAAVPLLLERMLSNSAHNWWETGFQYNAFLVIILACAAVDGAARLDRWLLARRHRAGGPEQAASAAATAQTAPETAAAPGASAGDADSPAGRGREAPDVPPAGAAKPAARPSRQPWTVALACAAAMCAVAVILVPHFAYGPALHRSYYQRTGYMKAALAANAVIPDGVVVAALNVDGSQLASRDTVLLFDGDGGTPPLAAQWVVANVGYLQFTFPDVAKQRLRVKYLEQHGYRAVFRRGGYIVLHRPGPARLTPALVGQPASAG